MMDVIFRILAAIGFDCSRHRRNAAQSSPAVPVTHAVNSQEISMDPYSLYLDPDPLHCQSCISYEARLHRLVCGHLYCNKCRSRIVNQAFQDIEGLSDYACPMCRSIRQLTRMVPGPRPCSGSPTGSIGSSHPLPSSTVTLEVIREEDSGT